MEVIFTVLTFKFNLVFICIQFLMTLTLGSA